MSGVPSTEDFENPCPECGRGGRRVAIGGVHRYCLFCKKAEVVVYEDGQLTDYWYNKRQLLNRRPERVEFSCKKCGQGAYLHENEEFWFCPVCEDV